jgi:hypothetical protein
MLTASRHQRGPADSQPLEAIVAAGHVAQTESRFIG